MNEFNPRTALVGGALIRFTISVLVLSDGRVLTINPSSPTARPTQEVSS